jgi:hypothetical protein
MQIAVKVVELKLNCFERIIHAHETRVHFSIRIHHCLFFIDEQVQMKGIIRREGGVIIVRFREKRVTYCRCSCQTCSDLERICEYLMSSTD